MSLAAERANAARWIASKVTSTGFTDTEAASHWGELTLRLEDCRSEGAEELAILEWRVEMEHRLSVRLAHAPLERTSP